MWYMHRKFLAMAAVATVGSRRSGAVSPVGGHGPFAEKRR